jgi:hypothetical protein
VLADAGSTPAASTKRGKGSLKRLPFLRFMELVKD